MKTTKRPSRKTSGDQTSGDRKKKAFAVDSKKVLARFKSGTSTGEICVAIGLPRNSASRQAVRVILRGAGIYEKRMRMAPAKADKTGGSA